MKNVHATCAQTCTCNTFARHTEYKQSTYTSNSEQILTTKTDVYKDKSSVYKITHTHYRHYPPLSSAFHASMGCIV